MTYTATSQIQINKEMQKWHHSIFMFPFESCQIYINWPITNWNWNYVIVTVVVIVLVIIHVIESLTAPLSRLPFITYLHFDLSYSVISYELWRKLFVTQAFNDSPKTYFEKYPSFFYVIFMREHHCALNVYSISALSLDLK